MGSKYNIWINNPVRRGISRILSGIFIIPVRIYQYLISPLLPGSCRFVPTCSEYSVQALKTHGAALGLYLTVKRIVRCHPFGGHGFDPVPPEGEVKIKYNFFKAKRKIK